MVYSLEFVVFLMSQEGTKSAKQRQVQYNRTAFCLLKYPLLQRIISLENHNSNETVLIMMMYNNDNNDNSYDNNNNSITYNYQPSSKVIFGNFFEILKR